MNQPILSILIATRNRIPYCINAIETILSFDYENFELVVQDNSDTFELHEYVAKMQPDKRLVYNYTPPPFSSIDNFNAVIGLAKGEYLCLIGDDDGVNPEIFNVVEWASENKIDSVVPGLNAVYWWPSACSEIDRLKPFMGVLEISRITCYIKEYQPVKEVKKLMKNGGNYLELNLPKLYHGIVKKELMDKIKATIGHYVGGLSPDIYTAVALSFFVKKIIKIDYPLTISGICSASTSADSAANRNTGNLEDTPHFRDRGTYYWSNQVPKFYSGINIWADSALASLKDLGKIEFINEFNVSSLSIMLLRRHRSYKRLIINNYYLSKNAKGVFVKMYLLYFLKLLLILSKIKTFYKRLINKTQHVIDTLKGNTHFSHKKENIINIFNATDYLTNHLKEFQSNTNGELQNYMIKFNISKHETS